MNKLLATLLIVIILLSCNRKGDRGKPPVFSPETIETDGSITPADSISPPKTIVAGKPQMILAGKPTRFTVGNNIKPAEQPDILLAGIPQINTPGENGYPLPKIVPSVNKTMLSGIPEVVVAKDAYSKDVNPESFTVFGTIQGLKHNQIRCLLQDRSGNLWFSNDDGVTRYDGKYLTHFSVKSGISNNIVLCMMEDREGVLWFGTFGGGVTRYDGKYFTHYTEKEGLSNNIVNWILQDKDGNYWFATSGGGVSKFDGMNFTHFTAKEGLCSNQIRSIFQDHENNIWFGTFGNGVTMFDGEKFFNYSTKQGFAGIQTVSIFQDRDKNIWFGSYKNGAIKYDGKYFHQYTTEHGLSDNNILCMLQDKKGAIWFGTSGGGISKFDGVTFTHFTEKEGLTNNYVRCSLIDKQGNMWFGTRDGGLVRFNGNLFSHYTENEGLGSGKVLNIFQDKKNNLWFGAFSGGVTKFDGKEFTTYSLKEGLLNDRIYSILEDNDGHIWLGSDGFGVAKFDGKHFYHYTQNEGLCFNGIRCMLQDRNGNLWFGSYGGGVSKFDGKTFVNYSTSSGLGSTKVLSMLEDKNGNIWFGTDDNGVVKFDGRTWTRFTVNDGLKHNLVAGLLEDSNGSIWIGTAGGGVSRYDGKQLINLTEKEGLTNNYINSLFKDKTGRIWMGTRLGPNILKPEMLEIKAERPEVPLFKNYSYEDGFLGIGCNLGALYEDRNGTIWIGSTNRLTAIYPEGEVPDTVAPNIQLSGIKLFNENIPWINLDNKTNNSFTLSNGFQVSNFEFSGVTKWYYLPENLSLAYDNNYLSFEFTGISQKQNQKIKYQYQLVGQDEKWSALTQRTDVSYGNLGPGKYLFKVKAMNSEGIWSNEYHYPFTIRPPWWNTWWFYGLATFCFFALIFSYTKWRERSLKQQKLILTQRVKEQTQELKRKNEELLSKNDELQNINSEKDKFFSIIAHDVRGPLSSFLGLTELMADGLEDFKLNEIQHIAETMNTSAANLLDLLGNLLEWARMQRGLIEFNPKLIALNDVMKESVEIFHHSALNKSITLAIDVPDNLKVFADPNMLGSVIRNLTSNAIKFTERGGKVILKAQNTENNTVEIAVIDTGIGMTKKMVDNLFKIDRNSSRPGTEGEPSTGLGLLLCKDFVEKQGGKIWAKSEPGKGSAIYFTLKTS